MLAGGTRGCDSLTMTLLPYLAAAVLVAILVLRYLELVAIALPTRAVMSLIVGGSAYVAYYLSGGHPRPLPVLFSVLGIGVVVAGICGHFKPLRYFKRRDKVRVPGPMASIEEAGTVYVVQRLVNGYWKDESESPSVATQISALFGKDKLAWRLIARTGGKEEVLTL